MQLITLVNGTQLKFDPIRVKFFQMDNTPITVKNDVNADQDCSKVSNQLNMHMHANTRFDNPKNLRIVLGHACNFKCKYCSQSHSPLDLPPARQVSKFMIDLLRTTNLSQLKVIQFWGGEPLLYWPTIRFFMDAFRDLNANIGFSIVTNGSLITRHMGDIILNDDQFGFILSHDGPGQRLRGIDPLNPGSRTREILLQLAKEKVPNQHRKYLNEGRNFAVNPVITSAVGSLTSLVEWYDKAFDGCEVPIAESIPVIPIQDNTAQYALHHDNLPKYTAMIYHDLLKLGLHRFDNYKMLYDLFLQKWSLPQFLVNPKKALCFTTDPYMLTLDLNGKILPCQTFAASDYLGNGEPASYSSLLDFGDKTDLNSTGPSIKMPTVHGYSSRGGKCDNCPVVSFCMGGCPYLVNGQHDIDCRVKYHHFLGLLFTFITMAFGEKVLKIETIV